MSTDDSSSRDFIFVDGLKSKPRGTIRSHISREVYRRRKIERAQAYQNVPSSGLVGWQQKSQLDDEDGHAQEAANQDTLAHAAQARQQKALSVRRPALWDAGQTRRKHNLPRRRPPQQQSTSLLGEYDPLDEDLGSRQSRDHDGLADALDRQQTQRERGRSYGSGHNTSRTQRIDQDPARSAHVMSMERVCTAVAGSLDPFHIFPVKMDPPTQRVLYRLLDDSPSNRFRAYRDAWFSHAVSDTAAFKQFLSTFSLFMQRLAPSAATEAGALTVTLHTQALRSVNERIMRPTIAADEGLLVAIMSFIAHYQLLEKYDAWQTHIHGLKDIIRLCGGLERAFSNKTALRNMLFFIDLQGSWLQDRHPHFPLPHDSLPDVPSLFVRASVPSIFPLAIPMSTTWRDKFPQQPAIPSLLDDLAIVTAHLISESSHTAGAVWTDSIATGVWVNPIVHRLLQLRIDQPDGANYIDVLQESFRIAALLHLARIKFHSGLVAGLTRIHVAKLKVCLCRAGGAPWLRLEPLKLWMLVMGGMNAEGPSPERLWFELEILRMARLMNVADLGTLETMAKSVLWMEDLFRETAQTLWRDLRALEQVQL